MNRRRSPALAEVNHATNHVELVLRFGRWMDSRATPVDWRDVADVFAVSHATAYRWIGAWRAANGMPSLGALSPVHRNRMRKTA